ncbi:MAG: lipopolysaccharide biosynthesis protein [Culicoidibacterales bacterium]
MTVSHFKNKKILFITPSFFGYEKSLKNELELMGAQVDMFEERLSGSFIDSVLLRLHLHKLISSRINKYFRSIFEKTQHIQYDYVWINNPEALTSKLLTELKEQQKKAEFNLYMWDNFKNKPMVIELLPQFDYVASFDKEDCQKFQIQFLPLFYTTDYKYSENENTKTNFQYKVSFVATAHSDRVEIIRKLRQKCLENNWKYYFYLFLPNKMTFFGLKLLEKGYRNAKISDISFESLKHEEIQEIVKQSEAIVDIQHPLQTGLTMRTIEIALGMRKKLITTNDAIKQYDFFNPNNICVIDRNNPEIPKDFMTTNYVMLDDVVYQKYEITNWLLTFFSEGDL